MSEPNPCCRRCLRPVPLDAAAIGAMYCERCNPPKPPRRVRVYIAGPISRGDLAHNLQRASDAFERLAIAGLSPFCPHWSAFSGRVRVTPGGSVYALAQPQPNTLTHADWLAVDLVWLQAADAVLRLPGESVGGDMETTEAERIGIPVFRSVGDLLAWAGSR